MVWLSKTLAASPSSLGGRPDRARNLVSGAPGLLLVWVQRSDDDKEPTHE